MYTKSAAGLVQSYPPPRKIINNLNADYHVKHHHAALSTCFKQKFIQNRRTIYKVQNVLNNFKPKNSNLIYALVTLKIKHNLNHFDFLAWTTCLSNHLTSFYINFIKHNV